GSALTAGAGILFGSTLGVVCVSIASTLGAGLAFLVARYFARQSVEGWLAGNDTFRKLDEMTGRHGAIIVAITRLVPIFPFNLLNYGFGLTRVSFWTYVLWSWLCMLPGTVLYVVGADAITSGIAKGEIPWGLLGVLAAVIVVLVFLVKMAKNKIEDDGGDTEVEDELPVKEVS
ncbi:MAG: TVP38/TMEM64 family protein, partial [bacterium]|nr:TVP38/TMEM64 family protein [bacterium]